MPWPDEEHSSAFQSFVRAFLMMKEVIGDKEATDILQQELDRERVVAKLRAARRPALPAPAASASAPTDNSARIIAIACDALGFYGEVDHYKTGGRGKPSKIVSDHGARARETLAAIGDLETAGNGGSAT